MRLQARGGWMSVEVMPGGQRRIDRVLDPRFTDVSYLRRLLQGRLDILRGELARRYRDGAAPPPAGPSGRAPTGTAPPRCRSSSSDLPEGLKSERLRSDGYSAGPTA